MWSESALAALCGFDPALPDDALARATDGQRTAAVWLWWRLERDGAPNHPILAERARHLAAREAVAAARLTAVLDSLAHAGIPSLLMKGAALSYGVYRTPWMRPRRDDDVLVPEAQFDRASRVLAGLGYAARPQNPGPDRLGQAHYTQTFTAGDVHHVDLHWRPLVPSAFSGVPGAGELLMRAEPCPALGRYARAAAHSDALLLGCAHSVAHHGRDGDGLWTVDVHLLAARLDDAGWESFVAAARRARVARVCRHELIRARDALGTRIPAWVFDALQCAPDEPSARYLDTDGRLRRWMLEMGGPGGGWRAFQARALPSAAYMRARYAVPAALLPAAYVWRAVAGGSHWLREAWSQRHD